MSTDASGALTEAERTYGRMGSLIGQRGRWYSEASVERIVAARESAAATRADKAEAELSNVQHDYDARGERLWRLAGLTGYMPTESDNDATAEHVIADALDDATRARAEERERIAVELDYRATAVPEAAAAYRVAARVARGDA